MMLSKPLEGKIKVSFWGTRGSISTPGCKTQKYGGNTTCVYIQQGNHSLIFDAGTGIRPLGLEIAESLTDTDAATQHIFLSHTHWDHIQGLPFFAPAYIKGCNLKIYGSPKKENFLGSILKYQMNDNYFPVKMDELAADISIHEVGDEPIHIGDMKIGMQEQICHPGGSLRFRVECGGKRIVYSTDVELDAFFQGDKSSPEQKSMQQDYRNFIQEADLLIADGQYTTEEYETKKGWGHTSIPLLLQIAHEQGVKQLVITHHDPDHSDNIIDDLWHKYEPIYRTATPAMNVLWAREKMALEI